MEVTCMGGPVSERSQGTVRLLVQASGPIIGKPVSLGLSGPGVQFEVEPLFKSIGRSDGAALAPGGSQWHLVKTRLPSAGIGQWDLCHRLLEKGGQFAEGGISYAEPDLEQKWDFRGTRRAETQLGMREGAAHQQDTDFPVNGDNFWFRSAGFGQFDAALEKLSDPGPGKRVRIAHLDTGYDQDHATRPAFLSTGEQRNFVDDDLPNDATDRSSGLLNSFSHGTGTLSILAGRGTDAAKAFGCAPNAEIIPLRVANRVVLFRNSAIARAMDHVHMLCRAERSFVHVLTMSMGGLPSQSWIDAVNALYESGVFVVTAAGNNYGNLPSHYILYPARFGRVVAACGSMADGKAYADLSPFLMAGDYGPQPKMKSALSAYTPNVPWARFGEPQTVDFDGAGTSAATPQVAGSAALWIQKYRSDYDKLKGWQRVEAVRTALFSSADRTGLDEEHFGMGRLKAASALKLAPGGRLEPVPPDQPTREVIELLVGEGTRPVVSLMHELELRQILQATGLEMTLDKLTTPAASEAVVSDILAVPSISEQLRKVLSQGRSANPVTPPLEITRTDLRLPAAERLNLQLAKSPQIGAPHSRRIRVFAYDPSPQTDPELFGINEAVVSVPWEAHLQEGPSGDYIEVVDIDPASGCCYAPVDLNHPHLLAIDGYAPSEANPQFHQQMVYAVAMRTIARFERALGRKALWAPRLIRDANGNLVDKLFVQKLRIYPHAIRERNAYYSSRRTALLFGYFAADATFAGNALPGSQVFCAVSHDIIAHETTHALLDGLHPRFQEATNPDVLAFHEAFADIVALFLHFTMPESLLQQIKRTKGDFLKKNLVGQLAVQFGEASGMRGALRSAIGRENEQHVWEQTKPSRTDYQKARDDGAPHRLGSVLVSAVFAAFVTIYRARSADLIRLATNGTGILPEGEISQDLALRLAREASSVADQVLNICIRALDYVPPTDITFGEYLRALITADRDLVPEDTRGYRVAFIAAFRDRGIFPSDVRHLAEDSLVWLDPPLDAESVAAFPALVSQLSLDWNLNSDRRRAFDTSDLNRLKVSKWLRDPSGRKLLDAMGFEPAAKRTSIAGLEGELRNIEVHSVRPTRRTAPDGSSHAWLIVEITQTFRADPNGERYRGGCTLIVDLNTNKPRYFIRKRLRAPTGLQAQRATRVAAAARAAELGVPYVSPGDSTAEREAFALLHKS
jgi:hypothetical protein